MATTDFRSDISAVLKKYRMAGHGKPQILLVPSGAAYIWFGEHTRGTVDKGGIKAFVEKGPVAMYVATLPWNGASLADCAVELLDIEVRADLIFVE